MTENIAAKIPDVEEQIAQGVSIVPLPPYPESDLRGFKAERLNALASTLTDLFGFLPLDVRYGAAGAALHYVALCEVGEEIDPTLGISVSPLRGPSDQSGAGVRPRSGDQNSSEGRPA